MKVNNESKVYIRDKVFGLRKGKRVQLYLKWQRSKSTSPRYLCELGITCRSRSSAVLQWLCGAAVRSLTRRCAIAQSTCMGCSRSSLRRHVLADTRLIHRANNEPSLTGMQHCRVKPKQGLAIKNAIGTIERCIPNAKLIRKKPRFLRTSFTKR